MFDNSKPNVIILSDFNKSGMLQKTFGPYKVAYELRKAGYEVAVLHHLHVFSFEEIKHVLQHLISDKTLFVGVNNVFYDRALDKTAPYVSRTLPHYDMNEELKRFIQSCNPCTKLVLGGPTAPHVFLNKIFDYLVVGYADLSIVNLANHLSNGEALRKSHKSVFGPVVINDRVAEGFDFVHSTVRYEDHDAILPGETLIIEISRGCIFRCAFCAYPLNGKKKLDYIKQENLLLAEFMDNFTRFGVTRYVFSDDTFNDSVEKCEMIYRIAKQLPFQLEWFAFLRLDLLAAHPETIDLLFAAGLRAAFFGVESMDKKASATIGKGGSREKLIATVRQIKEKYGESVSLHGAFILGLPYETLESMKQTMNFISSDESPFDSWTVNPLNLNFNLQKDADGTALTFTSEFEQNPKKYGYIQDIENGGWRNEFTNYNTVEDMSKLMNVMSRLDEAKIPGGTALSMSGLGVDLDTMLNKKLSEIRSMPLSKLKWLRGKKYKQKFYEECDIPRYTGQDLLDQQI